MRLKCNRKRGFTLVEVIVVLVILAILAAIMIPAMTGWSDKAKERRLIVACRTCVTAAQTLAVEEYGETGAVTSVDEGAVKTLAGVPGDVSAIAFDNATVTKLTYVEDSEAMTYTRDPSPKYTFGSSTIRQETVTDILGKIVNANADGLTIKVTSTIDSSAADRTAESNAAKVEAMLKQKDIDLDKMNVAAWKYIPAKKDKDGLVTGGPFFYWTDTDISKLNDGQKIPVMRYNSNSGSYTVWEATVSTSTNNDKIFAESKRLTTEEKAADQTYDLMLEDYAQIAKSGKYPK